MTEYHNSDLHVDQLRDQVSLKQLGFKKQNTEYQQLSLPLIFDHINHNTRDSKK